MDIEHIEALFHDVKTAWKKLEEIHYEYLTIRSDNYDDEAWLDSVFEAFIATPQTTKFSTT